MLRITELVAEGKSGRTLRLEGKLVGPWVAELRRACGRGGEPSPSTRLELASVSYVDSAGIALLRELVERGVVLSPCSPYVSELLKPEYR